MKSRWSRLFGAVKRWWGNEPPPAPDLTFLDDARKLLREYDDLYGRRSLIDNPEFRSQAAEIVFQEGHKRKPTLESEVRVLSIVLERLVGHLEMDLHKRRDQ